MWDTKDWKNLDLKEYVSKLYKDTLKDHPIIKVIDWEKYDVSPTGKLAGIPFAVKDNMAVEDDPTTSASKILKDYISPESCTIFKKLIAEGAIPVVKTNLDEFAMGGTGKTSNYFPVDNPFRIGTITGGSSSGSAYMMATNSLGFALGTDTGDSVRKPAAWLGLIGYKPTWGLVSRYGVYDFAPSWDTVSWFTNTIEEAALILEVLQGYDEKDFSSIDIPPTAYSEELETDRKFKVGFIPQLEGEIHDEQIKANYLAMLKKAEDKGHELVELDMNLNALKIIIPVYRTISSIEGFSATAAFTGFLYGSFLGKDGTFNEKVRSARTAGFDYEVKRRFLFGQEAIANQGHMYIQSMRGRTLIIQELKKVFNQVDVLIHPATETLSPTIDQYINEDFGSIIHDFYVLFNANGSPSLNLPTNKDHYHPTSIGIAAKPFDDLTLLQFAKILEMENEK